MFCKLEGETGKYVSYDQVSKSNLSKIVEIKFDGLNGNDFREKVALVDWKRLTKLKKIQGINSNFKGYIFPKDSLPKLEEIEFQQCDLYAETLTSLLNAVPRIDSKTNFTFIWDELSSLSSAFLNRGDQAESEFASFEVASKRIERIRERNSGKTTVEDLDEDEDDGLLEVSDDELSDGYDLDDRSITDSSNSGESNSSKLSGNVVLRSLRDQLTTEDDDSSSDVSLNIRTLSEEGDVSVDDNGSLSTFSESPDSNPPLSILKSKLSVALWDDEDDLSADPKIECRLAGDDRPYVYSSIDERQRMNIVEMRISGTGPNTNVLSVLPATEWNSLTGLKILSIQDASITTKYLTTVPKITLPRLTTLKIGNCGIDLKGLNCLVGASNEFRTLQHQGALQKATWTGKRYSRREFLANEVELDRIEQQFMLVEQSIDQEEDIERDDISPSGIGTALGDGTTTRQVYEIFPTNRRRQESSLFDELDSENVDVSSHASFTIAKLQGDPDIDSDSNYSGSESPRQFVPTPSTQSGLAGYASSEAGLSNRRGMGSVDSLSEPGVRIEVTYHQSQLQLSTSGTSIPISLSLTIQQFNALPEQDRNSIETMTITGQGPGGPDVGGSLKWSNLKGLRELRLRGVTVGASLAQETFFDSLESIQFERCGVSFKALESFYTAADMDLKVIKLQYLSGLDLTRSVWRPLNESEIYRIQTTLAELNRENSGNFEADYEPDISSQRSSQSEIRDLPPDMQGMQGIFYQFSGHKGWFEYSREMPLEKKSQIIHMFINGEGIEADVVSAVDWGNLSGLQSLEISNAVIAEKVPADDSLDVEKLFPNIRTISFNSCRVANAQSIQSFYEQTGTRLEDFVVNDARNLDGTLALKKQEQRELAALGATVRAAYARRGNQVEDDDEFLGEDVLHHGSRMTSNDSARFSQDSDIQTGRGFIPQDFGDLEDDYDEIISNPRIQAETGRRIQTDKPEILCFFGGGTSPTLYSDLRPEQLKHIRVVVYDGLGQDEDAMTRVKWAEMRGLWQIDISNALVESDTPFEGNGEEILFPELSKMTFSNCRLGSEAVRGFVEHASEDLLTKLDISSDCKIADGAESQAIAQIKARVNHRSLETDFPRSHGNDGGRPHTMRATGGRNSLHQDPLRVYSPGSNRSDSRTSRRGNELGDDEEFLEDVDLSLPQSPQLSTRSGTAEIICYFDTPVKKLYSELNAEDLGRVRSIDYHGTGPEDNAMATVDWKKLTGLQRMNIFNASVSDAVSFRGEDGKTLFPELSKMCFYGCKLGPKAIDSFVKHASPNLQTFEMSHCYSGVKGNMQKIEELQVAVNQRIKAFVPPTMPSHGASNRRSATGRANSWRQDEQWMESPGSNSSESSTPRNSSRTTIHSEDGVHNRTRPASRGPSSTVAAGAATNRPSLFTPPPAQHRTTSAGNLGSVHTAGATTGNFQGRIRELRSREAELVVGNESVNSRDYNKLVSDTEEALSMIQAENSSARGNYMLFEIEGSETINIAYQADDNRMTSILDASIDTVKVHRGWRQVDRTISHEARAQIVLASLGIPPCPPDIAISNEGSRLGRAIRAEFTKLQRDEPEIIVRRVNH